MQTLKTKLNSFHQNVQRIQKADDSDAIFKEWLQRFVDNLRKLYYTHKMLFPAVHLMLFL